MRGDGGAEGGDAPAVSVILPVRDGARFLAEAVESVLTQAGADDLEIVAVDDGSTDATAAILGRCPRTRVVAGGTPEAPIGPSAARNRGLASARGRIVGFIDHDDIWPPGKLATQRAALDADPGIDVVSGLIEIRCLDGRTRPEFRTHRPDGRMHHVNLGASLFRASVFERLGGFAEDMAFAEDVDLFTRIAEAGLRQEKIEALGLVYRLHATNMTRGRTMSELNAFEALRRHLRRKRASEAAGR